MRLDFRAIFLFVFFLLYLFVYDKFNSSGAGSNDLEVRLPIPLKVISTLGDRYLAANFEYLRVVTSESSDKKVDAEVRAKIQSDIAWLNPRHEDNYYIAAATLPWEGQVERSDFILKSAVVSRDFDWQPVFYYAFNKANFHSDAISAAELLRDVAAPRARDEGDRYAILVLSAKWFEKGYDKKMASLVVNNMAKSSKDTAFSRYLKKRADRLQNIEILETCIADFHQKTGSWPKVMSDEWLNLNCKKLMPDPFGWVYVIKDEHNVAVLPKSSR